MLVWCWRKWMLYINVGISHTSAWVKLRRSAWVWYIPVLWLYINGIYTVASPKTVESIICQNVLQLCRSVAHGAPSNIVFSLASPAARAQGRVCFIAAPQEQVLTFSMGCLNPGPLTVGGNSVATELPLSTWLSKWNHQATGVLSWIPFGCF